VEQGREEGSQPWSFVEKEVGLMVVAEARQPRKSCIWLGI
jgi:hypothetical protein